MIDRTETRRIYSNISPEVFDQLKAKARQDGFYDATIDQVDLARVLNALVQGYATGRLHLPKPGETEDPSVPTQPLTPEEEDAKWNR